ncbi:Agamous-like MADS-box protein AGL97 [Arabidopsis thaliana]|uniref:AGL97 n=2 Tax=Arabidopsis TaxID=3701 RepID=A0A178W509_ARATH|nr:Transcription factor MADS-box [Arabidopsis thaliana x Arabidopsis arenosa]OAP12771.1 AGL97 [Arabidopsis thaliana]
MGGVKRKIAIEKIQNKNPRAVSFSKRRKGLYSKASELCLLSDAEIAIIATPVSSNSNPAFYSFGHSSVDNVVAAFLANQRPCDERFWWEDESLLKSENLEELREAMDSMSTMLRDLKELEKQRDHQTQTLIHQPCSARVCIQDYVTVNFDGFNTEEQTLAVSDNSNNNGLLGNLDECNEDFDDLDQIFDTVTNSEFLSVNLEMDDVTVNSEGNTEEQTLAVSDNSNNNGLLGNLDECNEDFDDLDQIIEYLTSSEALSMNLKMDDV